MGRIALTTCKDCGRELFKGDEVYENETKVINVDSLTVSLKYTYSCWPACPPDTDEKK